MIQKTVLVVDDDIEIGNLEQEVLIKAGFRVVRAYSGTEVLLLLKNMRPDAILLDLMLPGMSGEELLPLIRGIPVIAVSAKSDIDGKVGVLLGGAEDYITKPFSTKELLARVEVCLRKHSGDRTVDTVVFGNLTLDTSSHEVTLDGKSVCLTKTEYAVLKLLMLNSGKVTAKSVILDRISADTPDCTEISLKTHISHLRGKLREVDGREHIEAVWGIGYKMIE